MAPVTRVGSEILVNTATTGNQNNPQITSLAGGGFVVTWQDSSLGVGGATGDSSGVAIKAQVFSAGGAPVGGEILVNTATANDQLTPQITALSNGGFVVTWSDLSLGVGGATGDTSNYAVKARRAAVSSWPGMTAAKASAERREIRAAMPSRCRSLPRPARRWAARSWSTPGPSAASSTPRSRRCRTAASW